MPQVSAGCPLAFGLDRELLIDSNGISLQRIDVEMDDRIPENGCLAYGTTSFICLSKATLPTKEHYRNHSHLTRRRIAFRLLGRKRGHHSFGAMDAVERAHPAAAATTGSTPNRRRSE